MKFSTSSILAVSLVFFAQNAFAAPAAAPIIDPSLRFVPGGPPASSPPPPPPPPNNSTNPSPPLIPPGGPKDNKAGRVDTSKPGWQGKNDTPNLAIFKEENKNGHNKNPPWSNHYPKPQGRPQPPICRGTPEICEKMRKFWELKHELFDGRGAWGKKHWKGWKDRKGGKHGFKHRFGREMWKKMSPGDKYKHTSKYFKHVLSKKVKPEEKKQVEDLDKAVQAAGGDKAKKDKAMNDYAEKVKQLSKQYRKDKKHKKGPWATLPVIPLRNGTAATNTTVQPAWKKFLPPSPPKLPMNPPVNTTTPATPPPNTPPNGGIFKTQVEPPVGQPQIITLPGSDNAKPAILKPAN